MTFLGVGNGESAAGICAQGGERIFMGTEKSGKKKLAAVSFTSKGKSQAERIEALLKEPLEDGSWEFMHWHKPAHLKEWCRRQFHQADALLFIGAMGIAVRTIAPFLEHKTVDPAVLVMDEQALHVVSVLSGHIGGGNELTRLLAKRLHADPVITTASDVNQKIAVDVFAKKNGLYISDLQAAKRVAAAIVEGTPVSFSCDGTIHGALPKELSFPQEVSKYFVEVSPYQKKGQAYDGKGQEADRLTLIPKAFFLGIGCKKGKTRKEIEQAVEEALRQAGIFLESIQAAATIEIKREEAGLLEFCSAHGLPLTFYSAKELQQAPGTYESSEFVRTVAGVDNVCERAAVRKAWEEDSQVRKEEALELKKTRIRGVTVALAKRDWSVKFE